MSPTSPPEGSVRLRIDLAYDGGGFFGFARQRDRRTVQGELESGLAALLRQDVATTCAGRTDRGVHAMAQVVHVDVPHELDLRRLLTRLDKVVGDEITIWSITQVGGDFDARFSATERRYRYVIADGRAIDPRDRHRVWHLGRPLRIRPMQQAAKALLGEHDFASFCRKAPGRTTMRRIDDITVARRDGHVHVRLRGPAFCHQQVRSIVGCLVEVGLERRTVDWLADVLAARDRSAAARVAPPHGLTLEAVRYPRPHADAPWRLAR